MLNFELIDLTVNEFVNKFNSTFTIKNSKFLMFKPGLIILSIIKFHRIFS